MARSISFVIVLSVISSSCASVQSDRDRGMLGAGIGAVVGAGGGAALSPNDENRGLNALVFGVSGALVGGLIGLLLPSSSEKKIETQTLEQQELKNGNPNPKEYAVPLTGSVPDFLKNRVSPAVVEEFTEKDSVGEDGSLHAPHKVYRIKRQAELIARPDVEVSAPKN